MQEKVKANWIVKIPENAKVLVKSHEYINKGDCLLVVESCTKTSCDLSLFMAKMSPSKQKELRISWENREVKKGDVIVTGGGIFPKKVLAPTDGIVKTIDEFYNLEILTKDGENKKILSPVKSKIFKIEENDITLEFEAVEFEGEALIEGKVWGEGCIDEIEKISELNSKFNGMVIMAKKINQAFVLKAEVVGVAAIITQTNKETVENLDTEIPIMSVGEKEWKDLNKFMDFGKGKQMLVNSKAGRVLLVLE